MSRIVPALVEQAFHHADAAHANEAIEAARLAEEARTGQPAFSYEVFVTQANVDEALLTQTLPRLVNFLHCKGFKSGRTPGVFLSLFTEDGLAFIPAGAALEVLAGFKGLSVDELYRRYGDGGTGDPKLLGA